MAIDAQTVLLCHCDGANGSTTLIDSSPSAHSFVIGGSISTAQSKFGGASWLVASTYQSTNYARTTDGLSDFQFGTGQFTVEAWVRFTAFNAAQQHIVAASSWESSGTLAWKFGWLSGSLQLIYTSNGSSTAFVGAAVTPALDTWHHVAVDRDASNVVRVYFNGAVIASATVTASIFAGPNAFILGNDATINRAVSGYLDEIRVSKGVARYAGAFTPQTAAFGADEPVKVRKLHGFAVLSPPPAAVAVQKAHGYAVIDDGSLPSYDAYFSNTVLLCHFDGANFSSSIIDSSPSAHTMVANAATLSTSQAKFGGASLDVAASYSSANYVYTNDKLVDFQFGAGQFTIETWVRLRTIDAGQQHVICASSWHPGFLAWKFGLSSTGTLQFIYSADGTAFSTVAGAVTPSTGVWHHVAVDRDASNTIRVYFNGAVLASGAAPVSLNPGAYAFYVGNDPAHNRAVNGWLDDLRITKGVARYAGAFAVPQAAYPDTGTSPVVVTARRRPLVAFLG